MNYRSIKDSLRKTSVIAYHVEFFKVTGSVTAAVFLSQAFYWSSISEGGWFWKTQVDWESESGLTRREQETARRKLRSLEILQEEKRGSPARLFFRVDPDRLMAELANLEWRNQPNKDGEKRQTRMAESAKLEWRNQPNCLYTENNTEIKQREENALAVCVSEPRSKRIPSTGSLAESSKRSGGATVQGQTIDEQAWLLAHNQNAPEKWGRLFPGWSGVREMREAALAYIHQSGGDEQAAIDRHVSALQWIRVSGGKREMFYRNLDYSPKQVFNLSRLPMLEFWDRADRSGINPQAVLESGLSEADIKRARAMAYLASGGLKRC